MRMPSRSLFVSALTLLFVVSLAVFTSRTRAIVQTPYLSEPPAIAGGLMQEAKATSKKQGPPATAGGSDKTAADNEAQEPQTPPTVVPGQERPGRPDQSAEPKPYDKVITKEAKSDEGIFTVHTLKEKTYYEIPKKELGKEFLWVSQIAKTTLGAGYGGQAAGNSVVKWERKNNRVLLRNVSYEVVADPALPVSRAVQAANNDTIIMAFNVEAF